MSATVKRTPVRASRPAGVPRRGRLRPATAHAMAYPCPGCACAPGDCERGTCAHRCCCIDNYPLPDVAGLPVLEVV